MREEREGGTGERDGKMEKGEREAGWERERGRENWGGSNGKEGGMEGGGEKEKCFLNQNKLNYTRM